MGGGDSSGSGGCAVEVFGALLSRGARKTVTPLVRSSPCHLSSWGNKENPHFLSEGALMGFCACCALLHNQLDRESA
jgi:hypothetical protein